MTHKEAMRKASVVVSAVLFAVGLLLAPPAAGQFDVVRADFQAETGDGGVFEDSFSGGHTFSCTGVDSVLFDYVDNEDADCDPDPSLVADNLNSDSSGGGRWHIHVTGETPRRLLLDFSEPYSGDCDLLNDLLAGLGKNCGCAGTTTPTSTTCALRVWISADRLFKKNASRQTLGRFDIFVTEGAPNFFIEYLNPLFICDDYDPFGSSPEYPNDPNWKVLQSTSCPGDEPEDVSLADVVEVSPGGVGGNISLGQWHLPIQIRVQRVPLDDGGGSCEDSPDLGKGSECTDGCECSSGKCKGPSGGKTCK